MAVFYVLLFIPMIIQHVKVRGIRTSYERKNKVALAVFFLLLCVIVMLRHKSVGTDTENYIGHFIRFSRTEWDNLYLSNSEAGFPYYNKLISIFSSEPQFFLAVTAIFIVAMIWPTYRRLCKDPSLTIVLFCTMSTFVMMFSGIKQMISIGLGVVAYDFVRWRKPIPFILMVLLAMAFHASAFILVFMYPLYHARITKKSLYFVVPILAVCFLYNRQIFGTLTLLLSQYADYDVRITLTGAYMMLVLFGAFMVFSFLIPDERKLDAETIGLRNFLMMTFVLQMFAPLHSLAMRMGYYYMIFVPLLLPQIIACRSKRWNQIAILARHVMVVFFLVYFFVSASGDGNLDVFPYRFFWEEIG